jgi:hypothetical protein
MRALSFAFIKAKFPRFKSQFVSLSDSSVKEKIDKKMKD